MGQKEVVEYAVRLARMGLSVQFLCGPGCDETKHTKRGHEAKCRGKIPLQGAWTSIGFRDEAALLQQAQAFVRRPGGINLSIITGWQPTARLKVAVVDGDSPKAMEWMRANLPVTPARVATSRQEHWYYRLEGPCAPRNLRDPDPESNLDIDVQADGRQVVCPPSEHLSGHVYSFIGEGWTDEMWESVPILDPSWFPPPNTRAGKDGSRERRPLLCDQWPGSRMFSQDDFEEASERVVSYMSSANTPVSVSGSGGDDRAFIAAIAALRGFPLCSQGRRAGLAPGECVAVDPDDAADEAVRVLLAAWNPRCLADDGEQAEPWSIDRLWYKVGQAAGATRLPGPDFWLFDDESQRLKWRELRANLPSASSALVADLPPAPTRVGAFVGLPDDGARPPREPISWLGQSLQGPQQGGPAIIKQVIDTSKMVDAAEQALALVPTIYVADGRICDLVRESGVDINGQPHRPWLRPSTAAHLFDLLSSAETALWYKPKEPDAEHPETADEYWAAVGDGAIAPLRPDKQVVASLMARGSWPTIRRCGGIIHTPILRKDGTVMQEPGYDEASTLLHIPELTLRAVSETPSASECADALDRLMTVIRYVPFRLDAEARAVWVAAVLTRFARFAFRGNIPMFVVSANVKSAGKGKVVDSASIITDGRGADKAAFKNDFGEDDRVILSYLMDDTPNVCLDNIPRGKVLESAAYESMLTTPNFSGRVIGTSKNKRVSFFTTLWWATGNDLVTGGDISRRVLRMDIEDLSGEPKDRVLGIPESQRDMEAFVFKNRATLVRSALTLLRGWYAAGSPRASIPPFASYDAWSSVVRQCVVWCGLPDPILSVGKASDDDVLDGRVFLFRHLREACGEGGALPSELCALLKKDSQSPSQKHEKFRKFLINDCKVRIDESGGSLGHYLTKLVGEVVTDEHGVGWVLQKVKGESGRKYYVREVSKVQQERAARNGAGRQHKTTVGSTPAKDHAAAN